MNLAQFRKSWHCRKWRKSLSPTCEPLPWQYDPQERPSAFGVAFRDRNNKSGIHSIWGENPQLSHRNTIPEPIPTNAIIETRPAPLSQKVSLGGGLDHSLSPFSGPPPNPPPPAAHTSIRVRIEGDHSTQMVKTRSFFWAGDSSALFNRSIGRKKIILNTLPLLDVQKNISEHITWIGDGR